MRKKLLSLLLCGVMVFGLAACGKSGSAPNTTPETTTAVKEEKPTVADPFEGVDLNNTLLLALNVMYNDDDSAYYGNEVGPVIQVKENGQYTVTFDCKENLSDAAKLAGIKGIKYLTSIYIKDYAVTGGKLGASNLVSCNIRWDKVVVDGQELTITLGDFKNGIKSSGIFDTNDPVNSWDGSAVAEVEMVSEEKHVINLTTGSSPQRVEVTFTLSDLVFK